MNRFFDLGGLLAAASPAARQPVGHSKASRAKCDGAGPLARTGAAVKQMDA